MLNMVMIPIIGPMVGKVMEATRSEPNISVECQQKRSRRCSFLFSCARPLPGETVLGIGL